MSTSELRKTLQSYIDTADEMFLKLVYALSKEYEQSAVVGYNADGSPITRQDLRKRVKAASGRVKSGDYITQAEIEKEIENW